MARYPLLPRLLVGLLAVVVFLQGSGLALDLEAEGLHRTAVAQWIVAGALVGFLLLVALAPREIEAIAPPKSPLDLTRASHYAALVAAAAALTVVIGLAGVVDTLHLLEQPEGPVFAPQTESSILEGLV